jgi:hypothetical protein
MKKIIDKIKIMHPLAATASLGFIMAVIGLFLEITPNIPIALITLGITLLRPLRSKWWGYVKNQANIIKELRETEVKL